MQETEIEKDFNVDLLNITGYKCECENNLGKRRVGFYLKNSIKYERKIDLEGVNFHLKIIDIDIRNGNKIRIFNIYKILILWVKLLKIYL